MRCRRGTFRTAIAPAVAVCALFGQSDTAPRFDVASVKRNISGPNLMMVRPHAGGLTAENAPLKLLMQNAYGVQDYQISGGPGWIQSDGYDIEAKTNGKASHEQVLLMLRSLLEDRFQLKVHHETRELPVYALIAAKSGLKLKAPKEGSCVPVDPNADLPRLVPGQPPPGRPCGRVGVFGEPGGVRMEGGAVAMPELTRMLAMVMHRPVLDRTGFTGAFDLHLEFAPDETAAGLPRSVGKGDPDSTPAAADAAGPPPIFAALQEQLGLRLESTKGPVDVLVIDHVERPTEN